MTNAELEALREQCKEDLEALLDAIPKKKLNQCNHALGRMDLRGHNGLQAAYLLARLWGFLQGSSVITERTESAVVRTLAFFKASLPQPQPETPPCPSPESANTADG